MFFNAVILFRTYIWASLIRFEISHSDSYRPTLNYNSVLFGLCLYTAGTYIHEKPGQTSLGSVWLWDERPGTDSRLGQKHSSLPPRANQIWDPPSLLSGALSPRVKPWEREAECVELYLHAQMTVWWLRTGTNGLHQFTFTGTFMEHCGSTVTCPNWIHKTYNSLKMNMTTYVKIVILDERQTKNIQSYYTVPRSAVNH